MKINRRNFLQHSVAASSLGWLSHLVTPWIAEAYGQQSAKAKRFGLVYSHYGWQTWNGAKRRSDTDFDLPKVFRALGPYTKDMILVTGMYTERARGYSHGSPYHLSDAPFSKPTPTQKRSNYFALGPSIDRFIGKHIGKNAPFSAIHVNTWDRKGNGAPAMDQPITDGNTNKQKVVPWTKPLQTHAALFNGKKLDETVNLIARRASVLDLVNQRINSLNQKLASTEKAKLEQFTESLRSLEKRLTVLEGELSADCGGVDKPGEYNDNAYRSLGAEGFRLADPASSLQAELAAYALVCNLTPSVAVGADRNWRGSAFGAGNDENHKMQHRRFMPGLEPEQEWRFKHVRILLEVLNNFREGDGTAADNTIVMYSDSTCHNPGDSHHQGAENMSLALFGSGGGTFKTGRWLQGRGLMAKPQLNTRMALRPPSSPNDPDVSMNEVFIAVIQAYGIEVDTFGEARHCRGPLQALYG